MDLSNGWSMQNCFCTKRILFSISFLILFLTFIFFTAGCRNNASKGGKLETERLNQTLRSEDYPVSVKFRSFQNSDSTWGFTVFVNSRPFMHYRKIPVLHSRSGFNSKKDAECVAGFFVKRIQNGDLNAELNNSVLDSLGILMN